MAPNPPQMSEDEIDDLLYFARAGETKELEELLNALETKYPSVDKAAIITTAKDEHSGNNSLHMAAGNGHFETTKTLLASLPNPTTPDAEPHPVVSHKNTAGNTPLHWAALNGHLEVVKALVMAANADPTVTNNVGHDAVYEAELNEKKDVVEWLLSHCEALEEGIGGGEQAEGEAEGEREGEVKGLLGESSTANAV
ncbi:ankyrin [Ascodesmis nigricans]|uniref:Ankyrin n=1 Tax=Ascodesmis nigricans TaxID=341454 RepID=A0A4S2MJW2_9PEZI|nr:ankyrin [Ascodesmis nigricans]